MEVKELPIDQVTLSEFNTRKDLAAGTEDSSIEDLANSIREKGLLNPIIVRVTPSGSYELIAGQRRLLACKKLGMATISSLVRSEVDDADATAISLIENVHRAEMNPLDKAKAFAALRDRYGGDMRRVSKETGIGTPTVKKYLGLLVLPEAIREKVSTAEGPAKVEALSALSRAFSKPDEMVEAYNKTVAFTQDVMKQILKASEGDITRIDDLVAQAQTGAFNTKFCRGLAGKLMCDYIPKELAPEVVKLVEQFRQERAKAGDVKASVERLKT